MCGCASAGAYAPCQLDGGQVLEHQAAFTDALRIGREMRRRMFDTIEQRHADDFANGNIGKGLYEDLFSAVRDCGSQEAAEEFEKRFRPLLNRQRARSEAEPNPAKELASHDEMIGRRANWIWIPALCLVGVTLGGGVLAVWLNAFSLPSWLDPFKMQAQRTIAPPPGLIAAKAIEPAAQATMLPESTTAAEAPVPRAQETEEAPESMTEQPATAAEQEQSPEQR